MWAFFQVCVVQLLCGCIFPTALSCLTHTSFVAATAAAAAAVATGLLSDTHPSVRAAAVQAATGAMLLPAASVSTRQKLHRLIVSLLADGDASVRSTTLTVVANALPNLEAGWCKELGSEGRVDTGTEAQKQTDRQTDLQTQTDRQTGRQTDRQTDRQIERQTDRTGRVHVDIQSVAMST